MSVMRARMAFAMNAPALRSGAVAPVDGTWVPADLGAQYNSHWTADDHGTANMTDDGAGVISSWKARSTAINKTAVTTARPTWGAAAFNSSYAGVTFAGALTVLGTATGVAGMPTGSATGYIFVVADQTALVADTGQRYFGSYGSASASAGRSVLRTVTGGVNRLQISTGTATPLNDTSVDLSGPHMILAGFDSTTLYGWIDGTVTTPATIASSPLATATTRTRLGADAGTTSTLFHKGGIRHWMILSGTLSAANVDKLFGWAAWDSGLRSLLPAGHPYKSVRP